MAREMRAGNHCVACAKEQVFHCDIKPRILEVFYHLFVALIARGKRTVEGGQKFGIFCVDKKSQNVDIAVLVVGGNLNAGHNPKRCAVHQ